MYEIQYRIVWHVSVVGPAHWDTVWHWGTRSTWVIKRNVEILGGRGNSLDIPLYHGPNMINTCRSHILRLNVGSNAWVTGLKTQTVNLQISFIFSWFTYRYNIYLGHPVNMIFANSFPKPHPHRHVSHETKHILTTIATRSIISSSTSCLSELFSSSVSDFNVYSSCPTDY